MKTSNMRQFKFKIGDTVRIIKNNSPYPPILINKIATIKVIAGNMFIVAGFDSDFDGINPAFFQHELILMNGLDRILENIEDEDT